VNQTPIKIEEDKTHYFVIVDADKIKLDYQVQKSTPNAKYRAIAIAKKFYDNARATLQELQKTDSHAHIYADTSKTNIYYGIELYQISTSSFLWLPKYVSNFPQKLAKHIVKIRKGNFSEKEAVLNTLQRMMKTAFLTEEERKILDITKMDFKKTGREIHSYIYPGDHDSYISFEYQTFGIVMLNNVNRRFKPVEVVIKKYFSAFEVLYATEHVIKPILTFIYKPIIIAKDLSRAIFLLYSDSRFKIYIENKPPSIEIAIYRSRNPYSTIAIHYHDFIQTPADKIIEQIISKL